MTIKLGIIGYGGMGNWHHRNASKVEGVEVVAVHDIYAPQVDAAKEAGLKGHYTLKEMLDDPDVNTVLVSTPNHKHKEIAIAAANAGKNVISEKPVTLTVKDFDEMVEAAEKNNVLFTVHQNRRWDKDFCTMRKAVESGMLGNVYTIESRVHGSGGRMYGWRCKKEYGGGMLYDWGVHLIDQVLYMYPGNIKSVYAQLFSVVNPEVDDYFKVIIRFENDLSIQTEVGTFCLRELPRWYAVGDKGTLWIDNFEAKGNVTQVNKIVGDDVAPVIVETSAGPTRVFAPQPDDFKKILALPEVNPQWTDFYKNVNAALEGKEELVVKPAQVRRVLKVIEAAFKSSETGEAVKFEN